MRLPFLDYILDKESYGTESVIFDRFASITLMSLRQFGTAWKRLRANRVGDVALL
ncbi:MAG: hypothetical protein ABJP41_16610 [Paracoccaceae bacterium]